MATLGVADRWADLAIASWSLCWNFGLGWEPVFYDAYGVDPDPQRIAYYRLMWELGP
jgi:kanamycin kinase